MLGKIIATALELASALIPVKTIHSFLNDKPAKDLKAETERKRAENDAKAKGKKS